MKIAPRDRLIIVAVGLLLVVAVIAVLGIYPQMQENAALDTQIAAANDQVAQNKALLEQRQAAKERAAQTDAASLKLANSVPENPELPALIIELQDIALQAGVQFNQLTPATPAPPAGTAANGTTATQYLVLPVAVNIQGTWSDTIEFMRLVNQASRAMRITQFGSTPVSSSSESTEPPTVSTEATTLNLEAYIIPAQAAAAPSTTPSTPPAGQ